jgi:hypothetical protein
MSSMSRATIDALRAEGITRRKYVAHIAAWLTYDTPDPEWHGDRCGCPDDRCIGFHHGPDEECGCLAVFVAEIHDAARAASRS